MWDLIVSVPDHCLSFYFVLTKSCPLFNFKTLQDIVMKPRRNINQHLTTCRAEEP